MTACQEVTEACLEKVKAKPENSRPAWKKWRLWWMSSKEVDKMEAMDLEVAIKTWLYDAIDKGRSRPREMVDSGRRWALPTEERYIALSPHCMRDIFVRGQARSALEEKPLK
jgi:hypothetical protein